MSATDTALRLVENLIAHVKAIREQGFLDRKERERAVMAILAAAIETRRYLADTRDDEHSRSRDREKELSSTWLAAADTVGRYDRRLQMIAMRKSDGWADPSRWPILKRSDVPLDLETIVRHCEWLLTHIHPHQR